ncbi:hypothetical protein D5086_029009 [Populus alba]|uniref:Uncharacterized protein n=1 Tax=Populus alba TaxID=43335 RepID=A0ACC4ASZ0_POPAL
MLTEPSNHTTKHNWNVRPCLPPSSMGEVSQRQDLETATSTNIIPSQFDQLAPAFCISECLFDLQQDDDYEIATFPSSSQVPGPNDAKMPLQPTSDRQNDPELLKSQQLESSTRHLGDGSSTSSGSGSSGPIFSSKKRITWTQGLHEKFVKCVNSLGGAAKAKPKAILKMMETKGLTIVQVKSHLQKYRSDKCLSECKQEKPTINDIPQLVFSSRISMGIKEAQQLQLDIEKHLHEQLEIQRNILLQNEKVGRQLELMLEQQQRTSKRLP